MDDAPRPSSSRLNPVKVYGGGGAPRSAAPKRASPALAGILVGIPAAFLWALVAYVTHYEIGWVAWGVGALIGLAVAKSAHEPSATLGPTAAVIAVAALLCGKILILEFALPPILRGELLKNREATAAMFLVDMGIHHSFSPELQAAIQSVQDRKGAASPEEREDLQARMQAEALARVASSTQAERERVVGASSQGILDAMGFFGALKELFSFWDLLWIFLAVSSAFKIAQRG